MVTIEWPESVMKNFRNGFRILRNNSYMWFFIDENYVKDAINFFGFDEHDNLVQTKELDLSICFGSHNKLCLFKNNSKKPVRCFKENIKRLSSNLRKWYNDYYNDKSLGYWKFSSENDYIIGYGFRIHELGNILPKYTLDITDPNDWAGLVTGTCGINERNKWLWNLEQPIIL